MRGAKWPRIGQLTSATLLAVGWPAVLLALGYSVLPLAGELTTRCGPPSQQSGLWGQVALLSLGLFTLTVLRVVGGRSPWPFIDRIRTILLIAALLWVGGLGLMMVYIALAFPPPLLGPLLASPALIPAIQTISALSALRRTENWKTKKRILLLAAITLGLPTVWIVAVQALNLICGTVCCTNS